MGYYYLPETCKSFNYTPILERQTQATSHIEDTVVDTDVSNCGIPTKIFPDRVQRDETALDLPDESSIDKIKITSTAQSSVTNSESTPLLSNRMNRDMGVGLLASRIHHDCVEREETALDLQNESSTEDFKRARTSQTGRLTESTPLLPNTVEKGMGPRAISSASAYCFLAFHNIIFGEVFPLWAVAKPSVGLGFTATDIGLVLSCLGALTLIFQLCVYTPMSRTFAPLTLYRIPLFGYLIVFIAMPMISTYVAPNPDLQHLVWPLLLFVMGLKSLCDNFSFTSVMILVSPIN